MLMVFRLNAIDWLQKDEKFELVRAAALPPGFLLLSVHAPRSVRPESRERESLDDVQSSSTFSPEMKLA